MMIYKAFALVISKATLWWYTRLWRDWYATVQTQTKSGKNVFFVYSGAYFEGRKSWLKHCRFDHTFAWFCGFYWIFHGFFIVFWKPLFFVFCDANFEGWRLISSALGLYHHPDKLEFVFLLTLPSSFCIQLRCAFGYTEVSRVLIRSFCVALP